MTQEVEEQIESLDQAVELIDTAEDETIQHSDVALEEEQADATPEHKQVEKEQPWPKKAANAVSRLKKDRAEARAQRDALQREIDALKAQLASKKEDVKPPTEDQFNSYSEFLEARGKFNAEQIYEGRQSEQANQRVMQLEEQKERMYIMERVSHFDDRLSALKSVAPDYAQVEAYAEPIVEQMPVNLRKGILAIDDAPKALYNLAKEGRLENLAYMPFEAAMAEIVQAQYREPMTHGGYQAELYRKVSSAPKPLKAVSGTGKQTKPPHEKSGDELLEWMNS